MAVFFFLSGYGITASFDNASENQFNEFPAKKIIPLYCINVVLIVIYSLVRLAFQGEVNTRQLLLSFLWGDTVIGGGWYIQATLFLYIVYFWCLKFIKQDFYRDIALFVILIAYSVLCRTLNFPSTRYESIFSFELGVICFQIKEKINVDRRAVCCSFALFVLSMVWRLFTGRVIVKCLSAVIWSFFVVGFSKDNKLIINRVTRWIGHYSFAIYAVQCLFILMFRNADVNDYVYALLTIVCTFGMAIIFNPIFGLINRKVYSSLKQKERYVC